MLNRYRGVHKYQSLQSSGGPECTWHSMEDSDTWSLFSFFKSQTRQRGRGWAWPCLCCAMCLRRPLQPIGHKLSAAALSPATSAHAAPWAKLFFFFFKSSSWSVSMHKQTMAFTPGTMGLRQGLPCSSEPEARQSGRHCCHPVETWGWGTAVVPWAAPGCWWWGRTPGGQCLGSCPYPQPSPRPFCSWETPRHRKKGVWGDQLND